MDFKFSIVVHVSSTNVHVGARSTQEEVVQCTVPPKQVCHGLSGRKVDHTIHVSYFTDSSYTCVAVTGRKRTIFRF